MHRGGVLGLVLGTALAALGCGSGTLHGNDGGLGGTGTTGGRGGTGTSGGHCGSAGAGGSGGGAGGGPAGCTTDGGCQPDLIVDWQIESSQGAPVTCDGSNAAQVVTSINGVNYPQTCPTGHSQGYQDILLPRNGGTFNVTVTLLDTTGNTLAPPQATSVNVTSCATYETPGPAILVVAPPAQ